MKIVQLVTKILAVVLIVLIAFVGIYVQKQNRMENIVKDYSLGMDLKGSRVIKLKVSDEKKEITKDKNGKIIDEEDKKENGDYTTEEKPVNPDEVKTSENYKTSKTIIEKRLSKFGVNDYVLKLDEESGDMIIEIPENDETDHVVSNMSEKGQFQIVDSEDTEKVLMDSSDIKTANVVYNTTASGTVVYLNIEFNKQGKEKLKNISTEYATVEKNDDTESKEENSKEDNSTENTDNSEQKKITMKIDDNKMITTSFDEKMENGSIQLSMGQATTDRTKLNENIKSSSTVATILSTGYLPVEYETEENEYITTDITTSSLVKVGIAALAIALIAMIVTTIIYKKSGFLAVIEIIGFIALYSLLIRYTNAVITLEGLSAIAVIIVMNYILNLKLLNRIKGQVGEERKKSFKDEFVSFAIKIIPICVLSIVFCFINWMPISSFGMTMFWGITLMALYNITVTRNFLN